MSTLFGKPVVIDDTKPPVHITFGSLASYAKPEDFSTEEYALVGMMRSDPAMFAKACKISALSNATISIAEAFQRLKNTR